MKYSGKKISGANYELLVLPRGDGSTIVIKAMAILDYDPFDKLCPVPRPPVVTRPGGVRSLNVEDERYKQAMEEYGQRRTAWMVLTSLRLGTPELEWEKVDYANPNTWPKYVDEMRESGFTEAEIVRVVRTVMVANSLDDAKLEQARKDFLASQEALAAQSCFLADGPSDTQSGEPASASD